MAEARIERIRACPACGSRRARPRCRSRERIFDLSPAVFEFARCGGCGVVYQSLRPVEADVAAFYPPDYGPYQPAPAVRRDAGSPRQGPHAPLHPGFRSRLRTKILRTIDRANAALLRRYPDPLPAAVHTVYEPPHQGATLLDFGCGSAAFLDQAKARGWDTLGVDFVESVVGGVRRAGHRAMLLTPEMWDAIPDGSLDCVRMNHVLEHLYDPHETLALVRRKLRPGGRLHAATPNAASLTFRLLGRHWYPLECPRHIVVYTPDAVKPLFAKAGFAGVACYSEVLTKDTARSIGYLLQSWGRLDAAGALALMHRPALHGVLFAPARLAALLGRADRFHAIASA